MRRSLKLIMKKGVAQGLSQRGARWSENGRL
jgi:hypothetical protein